MTWTTPDDVIDRWIGDEVPATYEQLATLIEDAEDMLTSEIPDLGARVGNLVPESRVKRVVTAMVHRVIRNPEGLRQTMQTQGPFSEQVMFSGDSPGGLVVTTQDRRALEGRPATRRAFTIYPRGV